MRPPLAVRLSALTATMGLLTACGGSALDDGSSGSEAESATVGLLVPKSGVYAPLGTDMENGFRLYLKQKDSTLGGKAVTVKVVDEGGGPDTGVPAGQQLAQDESVSAVVGVVNSAIALGLKDSFEEAKKPLIIANAGADAITGAEASDYVWRTSFTNGETAAALGEHVADEVKGGGVYLMAADYAAGKEALAGFEKAFTGAGGKVIGQQLTPFGKTTNFAPYLTKARNSGAKAVYVFYAGAEAVAYVKQYSELGLAKSIPLFGSGFLTEGSVLKAQGAAATGIRTSLHYSSELDTPRNTEFVDAYTKEYGSAPTVYSVQAYDAAAALDKAFAKGVSGEQLVEGLKAAGEIDSPRGTWSFSATHGPAQTYYLRTVADEGGQLVNKVDGPLTTP